jgi:hypothetical protein
MPQCLILLFGSLAWCSSIDCLTRGTYQVQTWLCLGCTWYVPPTQPQFLCIHFFKMALISVPLPKMIGMEYFKVPVTTRSVEMQSRHSHFFIKSSDHTSKCWNAISHSHFFFSLATTYARANTEGTYLSMSWNRGNNAQSKMRLTNTPSAHRTAEGSKHQRQSLNRSNGTIVA